MRNFEHISWSLEWLLLTLVLWLPPLRLSPIQTLVVEGNSSFVLNPQHVVPENKDILLVSTMRLTSEGTAAIPRTPNTRSMSECLTSAKCLAWLHCSEPVSNKSHTLHLVLSLSPSIFYFEKITPPEKCMNMRLDPPTAGTLPLSPASPLTLEELVADTHNCAFSSVAIT